ncbi:MAG TPA: hypothetical protein VF086_16080 [Propionibacteriaceae bacterium]
MPNPTKKDTGAVTVNAPTGDIWPWLVQPGTRRGGMYNHDWLDLKAVPRQRLHAGQDTLDFGDGRPAGVTRPILSTRSQLLWEALGLAYARLGFDAACGQDEVFKALQRGVGAVIGALSPCRFRTTRRR